MRKSCLTWLMLFLLLLAAREANAQRELTTSDINSPNGVAGLDANKNVTASILSPGITESRTTSAGNYPLMNLSRFPVVSSVSATGDPFQSPDSVYIGGLPTQGWDPTKGSANNTVSNPGSLVIAGQKWGPFNAGSLLSLLDTMSVDAQNGIAATDWRSATSVGHDSASEYIGVKNAPAIMTLQASSFSAATEYTNSASYPAGTSAGTTILTITGQFFFDPSNYTYTANASFTDNSRNTTMTLSNVPITSATYLGGNQWSVTLATGVTSSNLLNMGDFTSYASLKATHVSQTPAKVFLTTPLTPTQLSQLRVGMYIDTNVVDPASPTAPQTGFTGLGLRPENYYKGIINGWDTAQGMWISVVNWGQETDPANAFGMEPNISRLDTYRTNYANPIVFVGAPTNLSARNDYLYFNGSNVGSAGQSQALGILDDEIDLRYSSDLPGSVFMGGITISASGTLSNGDKRGADGLTQNSYMLDMSGDIHNLLVLDGPRDGNSILGHSIYLGGGEGSNAGVPTYEMSDVAAFAGGLSQQGGQEVRLATYMTNTSSSPDASGNALHLGAVLNGVPGDGVTAAGNQAWGQIIFNNGGQNYGGISFCGSAGGFTGGSSCGFYLNANGAPYAPYGLGVENDGILSGNALTLGAQPSGHSSALGLYTNTGYGNNIVEIMNGSSSTMTLTSGGTLSVSGQVISGSALSTGSGASINVIPASSASSYPTISASNGTTIALKTSVGGDASVSAYTGSFSGGVSISGRTTSGSYQETLTTPSSSSASCVAGQFADDVSYHYVCVAANSWKRVALSSF